MADKNFYSQNISQQITSGQLLPSILKSSLVLLFSFMLISLAGCDSSSSGGDNGDGSGGSEMTGGDDTGDQTGGGGDMDAGGDTGGGEDGSGGSIVEAGGTLPPNPETFAYVEGGTESQTLDYYRIEGLPSQTASKREIESSTGRPAIVWFHGGGWVTGSKDNIEGIAFEIAELAGFHLVSVGYRLAGQGADPWPGMIQEVKSAIRWLRLNADMLGIDPDHIIVTGESAGAHLAAMIASSHGVAGLEGTVNPGASSEVQGAVLFYGPYEFDTIVGQGLEVLVTAMCGLELNPLPVWFLLDCPLPGSFDLDPLSACNSDDLTEASPVTHVDGTDPPMFVASGTLDCFVPWQQALDMQNALNAAGVPNETSVTQGGEHDADTLDVTAEQVVMFLDENIGK